MLTLAVLLPKLGQQKRNLWNAYLVVLIRNVTWVLGYLIHLYRVQRFHLSRALVALLLVLALLSPARYSPAVLLFEKV